MKRRLFTILSALSLLLFVAVLVMWVRSGYVIDSLNWSGGNLSHEIASAHGRVTWIDRSEGPVPEESLHYQSRSVEQPGLYPGLLPLYGFSPDASICGLPYWLIALALLIPLLYRKLRPRDSHGLCPSCGYDLRATPGRCPECGLVPAAPPPPPTSRGNAR